MEKETRKLMTRHKVLHLRDDIDRLYESRQEGGIGIASIEDSSDTSKLHKKEQRKTNYCERKQHKQHRDQQNNSNLKTKMGRKAIV